MVLKIILIILIIRILLGTIIPLFLFPNHHIIKTRLQSTKEIKKLANKLKKKTKQETLKNIFKFMITNYGKDNEITKRLKLFFFYPKLFCYNTNKQLSKKQFLACHQQNNVLKTLLLNTNQFKKQDIQDKTHIQPYLIVHQYLLIKTNKGTYKVDPFFKIFKKIK